MTDNDPWPDTGMDLGHGVIARLVTSSDFGDEYVGLVETHPKPDGSGRCMGGVFWKSTADRPLWTLVSLDPLHLEPSLLCRACGHHGWIREGKWVPV